MNLMVKSDGKQPCNRLPEYQSPRLREYGSVSKLTLKPGTRTDGTAGTKGDRGNS